jgi:hypothetical protein
MIYIEAFLYIIPLRAEQVSEANLRSEQGGLNTLIMYFCHIWSQ